MKTEHYTVGVISDTHFQSLSAAVPFVDHLLQNQFANVDAILHAGDVVHPDVHLLFDGVPFYAVQGNMDPAVAGIPQQRIVSIGDYKIGLIHGWGERSSIESRVIDNFKFDDLDCIVYGHSHLPVCHQVGDLLVMNPGSATTKRCAPWHSVGLLYLAENISGEIINIDAEA